MLIATGSEDVVIPPSNALKLVNAIPSAWLAHSLTVGTLSWRSTHVRWPISSIASSQLTQQSFSSLPAGIIDPGYSSARPRFPAFADRLCVAVHVDFFQPFDAVLHCIGHYFGRFSYFSWPI